MDPRTDPFSTSNVFRYFVIVVPLVVILAAHLGLVVLICRRAARLRRIALIAGLSVATAIVWWTCELVVLFLLSFCSGCWVDTPAQHVFDATLGLPNTVSYLLPTRLPDLGTLLNDLLYGFLPTPLALFLLSLLLVIMIPASKPPDIQTTLPRSGN
jgi:hypothetical protein